MEAHVGNNTTIEQPLPKRIELIASEEMMGKLDHWAVVWMQNLLVHTAESYRHRERLQHKQPHDLPSARIKGMLATKRGAAPLLPSFST